MNSNNATSLAPRIVARTISVAIASFVIFEARGFSIDPKHIASSVIGCVFGAGLICLCLVVAYHGWFFQTARSIRWLCMVGAFIAFGSALGVVDKANVRLTGTHFHDAPKPPVDAKTALIRIALNLGPAILAILLYHLTMKWLVEHLGLIDDRDRSQRLSTASRSLGLIAVLIFASANDLDYIRQVPSRNSHLQDAALVFGPLLLAVGVYKLGMYLARLRIDRTTTPKT